jgi:hypothetical protein
VQNGRGFWGDSLAGEMDKYNHQAGLKIIGETLPKGRNRVTLADEKDQYRWGHAGVAHAMLRTAIDRRKEFTPVRHQRPVHDAGPLKAVPVVTYSLADAQFGYEMLRTCALSYPSMVASQLVAASIAAQTGKGLTVNMREHYSRLLFYFAVMHFLIAKNLQRRGGRRRDGRRRTPHMERSGTVDRRALRQSVGGALVVRALCALCNRDAAGSASRAVERVLNDVATTLCSWWTRDEFENVIGVMLANCNRDPHAGTGRS